MRGRWLPVGALVFLLVAVLVVAGVALARPNWFSTDGDKVPADRAFSTSLLDLGEVNGIRLSDDNATSQRFTVPVPVDSRLEKPVLVLRGNTEVAEDSTIFLRVLVDGDSVYVAELESGNHRLKVDIDLPESAAEDGELEVQVRTTGSLDQRRCNITTELGALVNLDATGTRVRGKLDEPLHTVRDVVAELGHEVSLVLSPRASSREWFATSARLGAFLTQRGHEVSYSEKFPDTEDGSRTPILLGTPDALSTLDWESEADNGSVRVGTRDDEALLGVVAPAADVVPTFLTTSAVTTGDSASTEPRAAQPQRATGDDATLESLGVDTSVQQITDQRSWRVPYSLADLPGGAVPTTFRISMLIPATTVDARWLLEVRLNDDLVASSRLPGAGRQSLAVPLPPGGQLVRNELTVKLVRDRDLGGCNVRQTSYDVQLLKQSALTGAGAGAGFTAVPAQYSEGFDVIVPNSVLEDPTVALAGLVPTLAEFSGWRQEAAFAWDGSPRARPFLVFGPPPARTAPLVTVAEGRIRARGFDLSSFEAGIVLQCVRAGRAPGMVLTPVGDPQAAVPAYGREQARLVTGGGGGFVVSRTGRVVSTPEVRAEAPR